MANQIPGYINPGPRIATAAVIGSGGVSSGLILGSGQVGSGAVTGQGGGGFFVVASGTLTGNDHASGTLSVYNFASGAVVRAAMFVAPFASGLNYGFPPLVTEELISGVRAVCISQSGGIRIAMSSVSGRSPAVGLVIDNVAAGIAANVYTQGAFQTTSGMADFSGYLGKPVWVGRSGQVVTFSGSFNSGGFNVASGGDFVQRFGVAFNSGAFLLNIDGGVLQNQLLGLNDLVDVVNRSFGA